LDRFFGNAQGTAVAVDFKSGQLLASHRLEVARSLVAPPGSTIKPFSLLALLQSGKLRADDTHPCSGQLKIADRSYACSHPRMASPIDLPTAIAYSCNEYVANAAARFEPGELATTLARFGLTSLTGFAGTAPEAIGHVDHASGTVANQMQALGEDHVAITVLQLAAAYRKLAIECARPKLAPILSGLEGAVEFGTAQHAAVPNIKVAGKTGTAARQFAWFAGFAPSRSPRIVAAVMVQGHAGGADAAPIAGRIFAAYMGGKL
jgi:penicillin-binding protein 2